MLLRLEIPPQGVDLQIWAQHRDHICKIQVNFNQTISKQFFIGAFIVKKGFYSLFSKHIHNVEGILVVKYKSCVAGLVVVALINIKLAPTGTMRIFLATSKISTSANTQILGVTTTNMNTKFKNRNTNTF